MSGLHYVPMKEGKLKEHPHYPTESSSFSLKCCQKKRKRMRNFINALFFISQQFIDTITRPVSLAPSHLRTTFLLYTHTTHPKLHYFSFDNKENLKNDCICHNWFVKQCWLVNITGLYRVQVSEKYRFLPQRFNIFFIFYLGLLAG